ncbi:hypothetical protein DL93DRAFT_411647 [Clavulina sp. PMI_390]|nr:hypothetical protein DL93DRAFT_411647 [Clavulina sp. PMI_390]
MFADRISHFLWANLILGCYFLRVRRLEECFAVISTASRFAIACGLVLPLDPRTNATNDFGATGFLLSEPKNETEAVDRIRLAQSIYLMDQTTPVLGGAPPSFPYDARWELNPREASIAYPYGNGSVISEECLSDLWNSELCLKASIVRTFDRVTTFARLAYGMTYHLILARCPGPCLPPSMASRGWRTRLRCGIYGSFSSS